MKTLSNLSGFSTSIWAVDSSINSGYPYLIDLEETYKTYTVTVVEDPEDANAVERSFANVDGILYSGSSANTAYSGGILGFGSGSSGAYSPAVNLLSIANRVSASSSGSSYYAYSGDVVGYNQNSTFGFDNTYSYSSLDLSAVNTASSAKAVTNTISSSRTLTQIQRSSFLKTVFGPDAYQTLDYLNENPDAVWVIEDGALPELYYNLLNDITLSEVENGTISADKSQAVDGEIVTVTATPADGYQLNKIYVNGEEITGTTFEIEGDSDIYAVFTEETPEYSVSVTAADNAGASVSNADEVSLESLSEDGVSLLAASSSLTAKDGSEIAVSTEADDEYAVEAVYVNGEELASDSFIITADSVVTLDTVSISTAVSAVTNDADDIGNYFATLSGCVEDVDGASRYILYWAADDPDTVYTTDEEDGGGDYSVEVTNLTPDTEYCFQMTEEGEIKTFVSTANYTADGDEENSGDSGDDDGGDTSPTDTPVPTVTPNPYGTSAFVIYNEALTDEAVTADVENQTDEAQTGIAVLAAYSADGALVSVSFEDITIPANGAAPLSFALFDGAARYKLMIWSGFGYCQPLAEAVELGDV